MNRRKFTIGAALSLVAATLPILSNITSELEFLDENNNVVGVAPLNDRKAKLAVNKPTTIAGVRYPKTGQTVNFTPVYLNGGRDSITITWKDLKLC